MSEMENKQVYKLTTNRELLKEHAHECYHVSKMDDADSRWSHGISTRYTTAITRDTLQAMLLENINNDEMISHIMHREYNALANSMMERCLFDKTHIYALCEVVKRRLEVKSSNSSPEELAQKVYLPFIVLVRVCLNNLIYARQDRLEPDDVVGLDNLRYVSDVFHQFGGIIGGTTYQDMAIQWLYLSASSPFDIGVQNIVSILSGFENTPSPDTEIYNKMDPSLILLTNIVNEDSDIPIRMYADGVCAEGMYQPGYLFAENANILARNMIYLLERDVRVDLFTDAYRHALEECMSWTGEQGEEFREKFRKVVVEQQMYVPFSADKITDGDIASTIVVFGHRNPREILHRFGNTEDVFKAYMRVLKYRETFNESFVKYFHGGNVDETVLNFLCWMIRQVNIEDVEECQWVAMLLADTEMVVDGLVLDEVKKREPYFIRWLLTQPIIQERSNKYIPCDVMEELIETIESNHVSSESVINALHPVTHLPIISKRYLESDGFAPGICYWYLAKSLVDAPDSVYDWYWVHMDHTDEERYSLYKAFSLRYLREHRKEEMKNHFDSTIIDIFAELYGLKYVEENYLIDLLVLVETTKNGCVIERYLDLILADEVLFSVVANRTKSGDIRRQVRTCLVHLADEIEKRGNTLCMDEEMLFRLIQLYICDGMELDSIRMLVEDAQKRLPKEKFAELLRIDYMQQKH